MIILRCKSSYLYAFPVSWKSKGGNYKLFDAAKIGVSKLCAYGILTFMLLTIIG